MTSKNRLHGGPLTLVLLAILFAFGGCSGDPNLPAGPKTCEPGETLLADGRCQPAGLPLDMQCPPGELALENGGCQPAGLPPDMVCPPGEYEKEGGGCEPAGIPPEMCAAGFLPDGNRGCEPILPVDPCPDGLMAIPGDTVCREVMPCGSGDYGDIPVDATTHYVNAAYAGNDSNGTKGKPWKTIQAGINAAASGAIVAVAAGTYNEDVVISGKPVKLWGRCPGMVEVKGVGDLAQALQVYGAKASETEVHGVSITGPKMGVRAIGATNVEVNHVWIDGMGLGLAAQGPNPTSVSLRDSLIEGASVDAVLSWGAKVILERSVLRETFDASNEKGQFAIQAENMDTTRADVQVRDCVIHRNNHNVFILGSDLVIESSVVAETNAVDHTTNGIGVILADAGAAASKATIRSSILDQNRGFGIHMAGSELLLEGTVVRGTLPDTTVDYGVGIWAQVSKLKARSQLMVRTSVIEKNHNSGILVGASDAVIEGTLIRDTQPNNGIGGMGIFSQLEPGTSNRSTVVVRGSRIENNHEIGFHSIDSDATVESTAITGTKMDAEGRSGFGINIVTTPEIVQQSKATVLGCLIENNHGSGIAIANSDVAIDATVVRGTEPSGSGQRAHGIRCQTDPDSSWRGRVAVKRSITEQNQFAGIFILDADAFVETSIVRLNRTPESADWGAGILVATGSENKAPATLTMTASQVYENAFAGVYVAASTASIDNSVIRDTTRTKVEVSGRGIHLDTEVQLTDLNTILNRTSSATVRNCSITNNPHVGVYVNGSHADIETTVVEGSKHGIFVVDDIDVGIGSAAVRGVLLDKNLAMGITAWGADVEVVGCVVRQTQMQDDGQFGRGIHVESSDESGLGCRLNVDNSRMEDNHEAGVFVVNSEANIASSLIRGTVPNAFDKLGDGIIAWTYQDPSMQWDVQPSKVVVTHTRMESNARAGVANFGASVVLTESELVCHAFDLNGQDEAGYTWSFDGSSDNKCGCPEAEGVCGAKSAGLSAPTPTVISEPPSPIP